MPKVVYELGKHYTVSVLLFLLEEEEVTTTDFRDLSGHYKGPVRRAEELENLGYVEIDYQTQPIVKSTFRLTDQGEELAKKLKDLNERIEEKLE